MDNEGLINYIKSPYIINKIFDYIPDNLFKEKLFLYSKSFQKKLELNLIGLKEKYLNRIRFDIDKFLYSSLDIYRVKGIKSLIIDQNKKEFLIKEYDKFFKEKKISKEKIEKMIYEIFENKKGNYEKLINVDSPLFNIVSKTKNFEKLFTINMDQIIIDEYKLKDDYITTFSNKNIKYESISYNLNDVTKLNYLKEFKIDFNKIKRLTINFETDEEEIEDEDNVIENNNKIFFGTLFSFNNIENNLIYLDIYYINDYHINPVEFEKINSFKKLKNLYLHCFNFDNNFMIKLNTLKIMSIEKCDNIKISDITSENLEELNLSDNRIENMNMLEKNNFKQLKRLNLSYNHISDINNLKMKKLEILNLELNEIDINTFEKVDFKELKQLNLSYNHISDIITLGKANFKKLEKLELFYNKISDISVLQKENFQELKILNLGANIIIDINLLENAKFEKIEILDLSRNEISNIASLGKVNFKGLKILKLNGNKIKDIKALEKATFMKLEKLDLNNNEISDISILDKVNFKELKILKLGGNKIKDIKVLENVKFAKLEKLCLHKNEISDISVLGKVNFKELKKLYLYENKITDIKALERVNFRQLKVLIRY